MTDIATLIFEDAPLAPETINVVAYGAPKSGKSTFAATFPGPILWLSTQGPNALAFARKTARERGTQILEVRMDKNAEPGETSHVQTVLREAIRYVRSGQEPAPKTVVVDTIGQVRDALAHKLVNQGSKNSMQQWQQVTKIVREFVNLMRDLPVNLVLVAHQDVSDDPESGRLTRPLIGGVLTEEITGEADVIAYCQPFTDADNKVRYVGQLREARGRVAGDRSGGLAGEIGYRDLDGAEWIAAFGDALRTIADDEMPWDEPADSEDPEPNTEQDAALETDSPTLV